MVALEIPRAGADTFGNASKGSESTKVDKERQQTDAAAPRDSSSKRVLTGGVSHSDELPPLPASLSPGQAFSGFTMHRSELVNTPRPATATAPSAVRPLTKQTRATNPPSNAELQAAAVKKQKQEQQSAQAAYAKQRQQQKVGRVTTFGQSPPVAVAMNNAKVSKQALAFLQQQAKIGNTGTVGLRNYLQSTGVQSTGATHNTPLARQAINGSVSTSKPKATDEPKENQTRSAQQKFIVPFWLAGAWMRTEATELSRTELPSKQSLKPFGKGVAKVKDEFGNYRDRQGRIWQVFDPSRSSGSVDRGNVIDYHVVSSYNMVTSSDHTALIALRATHVVVDKSTKRIIKSYQDEELNTYTRLDNTHVRTDSSVKVFDNKGKGQLLTTATSTEVKLAGL